MATQPYGKIDVEEHPRGLVGADDGLAYVKEKKTVVVGPGTDMMEEPPVEQKTALEPEEHNQKYKKTDWKKRHDDLKRHHDRKLNELKAEMDELKANRPKFEPPKTPEEMSKFRAENPDIYDMVETIAHMRATEETEQLKNSVSRLEEDLKQQQQARATAELKILAPDYYEIASSDDFKAWAETQPVEIQNWIYKNPNNAQLAAKAINLYKVDRGVQSQPTRQVQSSAADAVVTGRAGEPRDRSEGRTFTTTELANMSWREYDSLKDEIDAAHRAGRVIRG